MTDSNRPLMNLTGLNEAVAQFAREREWDQFHSPKNLAMALTNEVGELIEIATVRGRKVRNSLKLGICGEHGGDPASIAFCEKVGLDYVSASPYRVPIARLAAAQAALKKA